MTKTNCVKLLIFTLFYFSVLLAVPKDTTHKGFVIKALEDNESNETQKAGDRWGLANGFQQPCRCFEQRFDVERLAEECVGTVVVGELLVPRVGVGGDDDDRGVRGVALPESVQNGEAAATGHDQVQDHEIGCVSLGTDQCLGSVSCLQHPVSVVLEGGGDHFEDRLVVVDQQQRAVVAQVFGSSGVGHGSRLPTGLVCEVGLGTAAVKPGRFRRLPRR